MKQKKRIFVIPAFFEIAPGEYGRFEDYPDAAIFGDSALAETLEVSRYTIARWKKEGIIPFKQMKYYTEYKLLDVVNALIKEGYSQQPPDNPTAHHNG